MNLVHYFVGQNFKMGQKIFKPIIKSIKVVDFISVQDFLFCF